MIKSTINGNRMPRKTQRFGVALESLNKQIAIPKIANIITASVPFPMPKTNP